MIRASVVAVVFVVVTCLVVASCEPIDTRVTSSAVGSGGPGIDGPLYDAGSSPGKKCMTSADCAGTTWGPVIINEVKSACSPGRACELVPVDHPSCGCISAGSGGGPRCGIFNV